MMVEAGWAEQVLTIAMFKNHHGIFMNDILLRILPTYKNNDIQNKPQVIGFSLFVYHKGSADSANRFVKQHS